MDNGNVAVVEQRDNVATALRKLTAEERITVHVVGEERTIEVVDEVPFGHKIALTDIDENDTVYKYGLSIGYASQPIATGEWVHVHNVESNYGRGDRANDKPQGPIGE